jgi:LacI family transcriptional regulator
MLIPDGTNQFFSTLAQLLQRELAMAMCAVVVVSSDGSTAREQDYLEMLLTMDVDGIAFISVGDSAEAFDTLRESRKPVVVLDREVPLEDRADFVLLDQDSGVHSAVEHLAGLGHTRVACIAGASNTGPGRQRTEAFREACSHFGITLEESAVVDGDFTFGSGVAATKELMSGNALPTAVFACNDLMALGAMQYLQENGCNVPEDVSVVGFDDIPLASWVYPRLTTVRQDCGAIARVTSELVLTRMDHEETAPRDRLPTRIRKIEPRLISRASSGPARV